MSFLLASVFVIISILIIILLTSRLKVNAFISLFIVSLFLAIAVLPDADIIKIIKDGFGNTMASIGFLIIFGAIIGITLDKTGGTLSIANYILSKTGEGRVPAALGITGFITGMPIFCNSGYIILSGLAKSFSFKTGIGMPFIATVLACSLYSVHCIIPTHPGALAAAGIMNMNIGNLILVGTLFAIPGALAAFFWSRWVTKGKNYKPAAELQLNFQDNIKSLPSAFMSLLPIVVPLLLITINSLLALVDVENRQAMIIKIFSILGDPVIALGVGVALALLLLKNKKMDSLNSIFEEAIIKAGPILIVTAAGGMFGMVIKATGVGEETGRILSHTGLGLVVPFLIAMVMKTAQGSSTVAIITSASFVTPMLSMLGLDSEWGKLLTMLAMGAGSMSVSHANDSYFWVVANFSDLDANTTLKVYSSATLVMGFAVFACVWLSSLLLL